MNIKTRFQQDAVVVQLDLTSEEIALVSNHPRVLSNLEFVVYRYFMKLLERARRPKPKRKFICPRCGDPKSDKFSSVCRKCFRSLSHEERINIYNSPFAVAQEQRRKWAEELESSSKC